MIQVNNIMQIIRTILLIFSCLGYLRCFARIMRAEFAAGFMFSGIGSIMFFSGILNIMPETSLIIFVSGLFLAFYTRKDNLKQITSFGVIAFSFAAVFFLILLYGAKFLSYDNFSHWALVSKLMLNNNRFPSFADNNVTFQAYPLGSTALIYYFGFVSGIHAEWFQMWIQAIAMTGAFISIFVFADAVIEKIAVSVICVLLLCGTVNFTDLLVDTMLPAFAVSSMAFCIYYKEELNKKIWFSLPWIIYLVTIKNHGILYSALVAGYFIKNTAKNKTGSKKQFITETAIITLSPIATVYFWQKHVKLVYYGGLYSKHSMSARNFFGIFAEKSTEDLILIGKKMLSVIFSWNNGDWLLLLSAGLIIGSCFYISGEKRNRAYEILVTAILTYIVYQIGTYGMYIFSMPKHEALELAGYDRYHKSLLIFLYGILTIAMLVNMGQISLKTDKRMIKLFGCGLLIISVFCGLRPELAYYRRQKYSGTQRDKYEKLISEEEIPTDSSYLILVKEEYDDSGYLFYLTRYLLNSKDCEVANIDQMNENDDRLDEYHYIVAYDDTENIEKYIENEFGTRKRLIYTDEYSF